MIENREKWEAIFNWRSWEDVFWALEIRALKNRGHKYISIDCCPDCCEPKERKIICYPNGTFKCKECGCVGDKVDYIIVIYELLYNSVIPRFALSEEEILEEILERLPRFEDPRQRRLFSQKKLRLDWA